MNAFTWTGPSRILAANPSMLARAASPRRILRDNRVSAFCVAIAPPYSDGDKSRRILKGGIGRAA